MGLLKELRKKQADGTITDDEAEQLQDLETDVAEEPTATPDPEPKEDEEEEAKAIDKMATKLAETMRVKMDEAVKAATPTPKVEVTHEPKYIVDKKLGKKTVEELDEIKVELPDRKAAGKTHTSVSMKTVHAINALITGDREKLQNLVEGTTTRGGFLVPEDFVNILIEDRRDLTVMRNLATVIQVSTDTIHLPSVANRPKANWRSEGAVKATTTVDFGETVLTPYSLAAIIGLSNELVADAALGGNVVSIVGRLLAQSIAEKEDQAFWVGDGSGKPTGIDNYTFTTVAAGAGASDAARADAIVKSLYALPQGYRGSAAAVANRSTWARVATLKDSQGNYLLSDLASGASPTLRGIRYYEQNDLGDGKMFVGDFSFYYIADREGIQIDTTQEGVVASQSAFERNLTFVRAEERVDGELTTTAPIVEVTGLGGAF